MAVHIQKRQGYISWDEYFMGVAILSGMRSRIRIRRWVPALSVRTTRSCRWDTTGFRMDARMMNFRGREEKPLDTKYLYVTHSELNAIPELSWRKSGGRKVFMFLCFRVMNVPRRSSRLESKPSYMTATNTNTHRL